MSYKSIKSGKRIKGNDSDWILSEEIGRGDNGLVWSALREGSSSEKRAIKFVKCASDTKKQRFEREVTTQSSFDHKSIVRIYEHHTSGANCWFSMPICSSNSVLLQDRNAIDIWILSLL